MEAETETAEPVSQESVKAEREEDSLEDGKTLEPEKTDDLDGIEILDIEETDKKEEVKKKPEKAAKPQKKKTEKKPFWGRLRGLDESCLGKYGTKTAEGCRGKEACP